MLTACISTYNDGPLLKTCLESLKNKVDKIIVIDGAYKDFPWQHIYPSHLSTDGSLELARRYGTVITSTEPWTDEIVKRQAYINEASKYGGHILVVDADEELIGDLPTDLPEDAEVMLHRTDNVNPYPVFRFHELRDGLHYEGTHHALFINGECLNHKAKPILEGCYLIHRHTERPKKRQEAKGAYYRHLAEVEGGFRKEWKL